MTKNFRKRESGTWGRLTGLAVGLAVLSIITAAGALWTNRYPRVEGFNHHVYLEGYELPILSSGPIDPAASPDGGHLAFANHGWIWTLDLDTGVAERITSGRDVDSRPAWSPESDRITFVRDNSSDLAVIVLDLESGDERVINTPAIDMDPIFSRDGHAIIYSSGQAGDIDLWRFNLDTGVDERITDLIGVERNPRLLADGHSLVYIHLTKQYFPNSQPGVFAASSWSGWSGFAVRLIRLRDFLAGTDNVIAATTIAGQAMTDTHPKENTIAYAWPHEDKWRILTADVFDPVPASELVVGNGMPQMPAWSADGRTLYFIEVDDSQQFHLMAVPAVGGDPRRVSIKQWNWGGERARIRVITRLNGEDGPVPARLSVSDRDGHPVTSGEGPTQFDPHNGIDYFYSRGTIELSVAVGEVTVTAVHGVMTEPVTVTVNAVAGETREVTVDLSEVWRAGAAGWTSGDHHLHLNYDGTYNLRPEDLVPMMEGENIRVLTPLSANLHNRLLDRDFKGAELTAPRGGLIKFGQEVRSHFHGHIGLIGSPEFYYPWHWGPGYPILTNIDQSNSTVLSFIRDEGGFGTYVHPVLPRLDPFDEGNIGNIPLEIVPDGVLGDVDGIEIINAWGDELGTASLWYRFLNLGIPMVAMSGTDMFADFHRTPVVGASRVYVDTGGETADWAAYLGRLRAGHNFVTNAPALLFTIGGAGPGDVVSKGDGPVAWSLHLGSAIAVENVEILVNGAVVWSGESLDAPGTRDYSGSLELPEGGWVAARAWGGEISWPAMDMYPFAHTGPVWIEAVGSTSKEARDMARRELLRALDSAEERANEAYGDADIATFRARVKAARERLSQ